MVIKTNPLAKKELRSRAHARLQKQKSRQRPVGTSPRLDSDNRRLLQELAVHQVELELQNEELQQSKDAAEAALEKYSAFYEFAPVGYFSLDSQSRILEANLAAATLLGVERRRLIRQPLHHIVMSPSRSILISFLVKVFATPDKHQCEVSLLNKDGLVVWLNMQADSTTTFGGPPAFCRVAISDITQRKRAEEALRASDQWNRAILQSAMDGFWLADMEGRLLEVNAAYCRMIGYTEAELLGMRISDLEANESAKDTGFHIRKLAILGEDRFESKHRCKDGRVIHVEISVQHRPNEGGRLTAFLRDITQRKLVEGALLRREKELADFFAEAPLGLLWVGPDGGVLRVNRAGLELLGVTENVLMGRSVTPYFADRETAADILDRLRKRETIQNYRARFRQKNGALKHVLIDANGLWEKDQMAYSRWFMRDITRRVELEREILAISEQERRRLGHDLHDDLCQQLAGIEFLCQTLASDLAPLSDAHASRATEIAQMMQHAMVQIRDMARGLSPVSLDAAGLIEALGGLAAHTEKVFRVKCRFQCDPPVLVSNHAVAIHLYRIAQEAVSNAIKHGKAAKIEIGLTAAGNHVRLCVCDNGLGLPKNLSESKGMGLRIMQYRAGVIGGSVVVQGKPGGGVTVTCTVNDGLLPSETPSVK